MAYFRKIGVSRRGIAYIKEGILKESFRIEIKSIQEVRRDRILP